ncbi:TfoX/Sxy family DNA transformation protein [Vibrio sp. FNV 38]|nr:TfoX/Sxy family DNA transformation protein [Vibrio sp. FNV 38]
MVTLLAELGYVIKPCNIFGNKGLTAYGHTFALFANEKVYFRATDEEMLLYKARGYTFHSYMRGEPKKNCRTLASLKQPRLRTVHTRYYEVTAVEPEEIIALAKSVIANMMLEGTQNNNKPVRLSKLANMTYLSERILKKVNIHSYEDLKSVGAIQAFNRLKEQVNNDIDDEFVLYLYGAIEQVHYSTLNLKLRADLINQVSTNKQANSAELVVET